MILTNILPLPVLEKSALLTNPDVARKREIVGVSVIEIPVDGFIRPGELVLSTGMNVGHNPRLLNRFITTIAHAGAAALALAIGPYTPRVPPRTITLANRLRLPLITLPWETRFSEISEAILRELVSETAQTRSREDFVWSLASRTMSEETAMTRGREFGLDLTRKLVGIVARVTAPSGTAPDTLHLYVRTAETSCRQVVAQQQLYWLGTCLGDSLIGYLQVPRIPHSLATLLTTVRLAASDRWALSWGVGRVCTGFDDLQHSYEDARIACDIGIRTRGVGTVTEVSDILADRVLLTLQREPAALALLDRYIEPLKLFQRMPLLRTLDVFFQQACNASETARLLAISRQSLLYRLQKIEALLQVDLHNEEHRFALLLSLRLQQLRGEQHCQ